MRLSIAAVVLFFPFYVSADIEPFLKEKILTLPNGREILIETTHKGSVLCVFNEGLPVLRFESWSFLDVETRDDLTDDPPQVVSDLNGDGFEDWSFLSWSRAAHGGRDLHVVTFDPKPRLLTRIEYDHWLAKSPRDMDGDGKAEVLLKDWSWAYWKAPFASSPAPDVYATLVGNSFQINLNVMRISDELAADIMATIPAVRAAEGDPVFENIPSTAVWGGVLDLLYGGHPALAAQFFLGTWPYSRESARAFLVDFRKVYRNSQWYPALKEDWETFEQTVSQQLNP